MSYGKRILIISHGHPHFKKGGAEVAAYGMYEQLRAQGEDAWFLARTDIASHGGAAFSSHSYDGREILFHTQLDDFFIFSNIKTRHLWGDFASLLQQIKPDVVHFHHYLFVGIEAFKVVKNVLPDCKLVLTLHEYLAICNNSGQMITTGDKPRLCYGSSPVDCHRCFPQKSPADFFLRQQYLKGMFALVDAFVSPSMFLKQRYVDWGLDAERIHVIENGQPVVPRVPHRELRDDEGVRLAYFGQLNYFKGVHVLLEALPQMDKKLRKRLHIDIHGANLHEQGAGYQAHVKRLITDYSNCITLHGAYQHSEVPAIMRDVDWTIMTSIWWENSPMVIQESFNYGRPIIVSDIGGMAEKVTDGVNGLHFRAGSAVSLARVLESIVRQPTLRDELAANITAPLSVAEVVERHQVLYG